MHILRRRGWEIPEREATPEAFFRDRRMFMQAAAAAGISIALPALPAFAQQGDPSAGLYPAKRNEAYKIDRDITAEEHASRYNNFFEFGSDKDVYKLVEGLRTRPWMIRIDGMVDKPFEIGIDDLLKKVQLEERVYRLRCVEAWGMTVPWTGFPMSKLVEICAPKADAKYIRIETFMNPKIAPGQRQAWYPWPYVEGCTVQEAMNELSFMVTGVYGKPLDKQYGAPIRLHQPWKYGFKASKSIQRISFTNERPKSFWETLQAAEYGFWANVNPRVPHPRWGQDTEIVLGAPGMKRVDTLMWNGYGEYVADMYKGLEKTEQLFM
ncbi:MAG: protein-methionine-sulfoxide reductase catalytic subunit MsrP [Alphaproteobacteria bacterium]|nr:protein-methionine-sulfoxide reductase catalytic subunit MsrP [Alphaproteobacteria bacterium]